MSNDITDHTRGRGILQEAAEGNKARHEQLVSMISDIDWRYRVNAQAEHVGSYISLVADRMLGLPDCTIGKALRQILFPLSILMICQAVQEILSEVALTLEGK